MWSANQTLRRPNVMSALLSAARRLFGFQPSAAARRADLLEQPLFLLLLEILVRHLALLALGKEHALRSRGIALERLQHPHVPHGALLIRLRPGRLPIRPQPG